MATITCTGVAFIFASLTCQVPEAKVVDTFCTNYNPVYWSTKDTRSTKEQNDINNRKWKRLCAEKVKR